MSIVLRFHTLAFEGERATIAEAIDLETHMPVASYSLPMMSAWLKKHGYAWRYGSSGIWDKVRAAA